MRTYVVFRTTMFPDEAEALARGEYLKPGKWLAEWLFAKLPEHGIVVKSLYDEDWGWGLELAGDCGRVLVACSQIDDTVDQWLVFCEEEGAFSRWFFRLKGKEGQVPVVVTVIASILKAEPRITEIGWFDIESEMGWDDMAPDPFAPLTAGNQPSGRRLL